MVCVGDFSCGEVSVKVGAMEFGLYTVITDLDTLLPQIIDWTSFMRAETSLVFVAANTP